VLGLIAALPASALARPPLVEGAAAKDLFRHIGRAEALRNGIPFALVDAVMWVESGYNPRARGGVGEVGLMQVLPTTAALLGFTGSLARLAEPAINIAYGARYLAQAWRLAKGDLCTTVMKYRAGHAQTRFSPLSIQYCNKVRMHLGGALNYEPPASTSQPAGPTTVAKDPLPVAGKPTVHTASLQVVVDTSRGGPARRLTLHEIPRSTALKQPVAVATESPARAPEPEVLPADAKPPVQLASYEADAAPRKVRRRASGKADCFRRVVQPGRRFGACISRSVLAKKGLLRG
jgi:hypothetical protein